MNLAYSLSEIDQIAATLLKEWGSRPVWAFHANMGAGKTTLIAAICKALGVKDHVTSPTFSLMNEYQIGNKVICHMDWYRIEDELEAANAGLAAAIDNADYCFIEWPDKAPRILPEDTVHFEIEIVDPTNRRIFIKI